MPTLLVRRKPDSGLGNIRSSPAAPSRNVDWTLLFSQAALTVIGCFVVYSASRTRRDDPFYYTTRQVLFAIAATVVLAVVMFVDYDWFRHRSRQLYVATLAALVLIVAYGEVSGSDTISFDIGPIRFQPAEFAKLTVLIALAAHLTEERSDEVSYPRFLGGLLIVGIASVAVIAQPDIGTASVLVAMAMGVLLVAGAKARYIAAYTFLALATIAAALIGRLVNDYQLTRVRVLLDENNPDPAIRAASYQVNLALQALGTGGIFGKGWLNGPLTNNADIPVLWADFPFAAVGEQFGLVGCAVLLGSVRNRPRAHLAHRPSVARPFRHLRLRRRVHDARLADRPERRHDDEAAAGDRAAPAIHLLRRLWLDRLVRHVRPRPERAHAQNALIAPPLQQPMGVQGTVPSPKHPSVESYTGAIMRRPGLTPSFGVAVRGCGSSTEGASAMTSSLRSSAATAATCRRLGRKPHGRRRSRDAIRHRQRIPDRPSMPNINLN